MIRTDIVKIDAVHATAFTIPTDAPESDGTYEWSSTTMVYVEVSGGSKLGIGWSYADESAAVVINRRFAEQLRGVDAFDVEEAWIRMRHSVRNVGRGGIAATAISAVDVALWDLKAKLLDLPLVTLTGKVRSSIPLYGSGGFTSYSNARVEEQLGGWSRDGLPAVKMKIGRDAAADRERVAVARRATGEKCELFVDANGAYPRKVALAQAESFHEQRVTWFEEPVSSDDLDGLRLIRDRAPAGMDIAAGEYGFDIFDFERMIRAGAVDVMQADATRCCGFTGFIKAAALCEAANLPMSTHCAPALHLHVACAVRPVRHMEYFHDHVRIESMLFDGVSTPVNGLLAPDLSRPGLGLELKRADAERYRVS